MKKRYLATQAVTHSVTPSFTPLLKLLTAVFAAVFLVLSGCGPSVDDAAKSGDSETYRLPWLDSNGEYTLQDISLSTFREPEKFRGDVAEIVVDPKLSSDGVVVGNEPQARFVISENRKIPADFVTLQAVTIYAHLERLAAIDRELKLDRVFRSVAKVGVLSRISDGSTAPLIFDNAIYDSRLDSLFFVPFSGEQLPISLNAGIIGHEHFHRIFQSLILDSIPDVRARCRWSETSHEPANKVDEGSVNWASAASRELVSIKIHNSILLRALNEGFADFWGWAYARDDEFVGRSLGRNEDHARRLDRPAQLLPTTTAFRNDLVVVHPDGRLVLKSMAGLVGSAYRFGTQYARVLRGVVEVLVRDAGVPREMAISAVRSALVDSMVEMKLNISSRYKTEILDPELLMKPFWIQVFNVADARLSASSLKASGVLCAELSRLKASADMMSGLCEATIK